MIEMNNKEIQFVSTERNQKMLIYRARCYTLKLTNKTINIGCISIGCHGRIPANLEDTEVIRTGVHIENCTEDDHALKKLQKPDQLRSEDLRPVRQTYDELANNTFTSLETADQFPAWD
ncbi:hypothetical protein T11_1783 [Trichinella zimbabwensis]|uniref:FLYWCH-type domain-containing protein n=1 Tax=Trichinella zimbabwensis TaxID=268475 RepID=A0A0V1I1D3_9BILA|nr:hypothetical protein T11_1783 [Trichinella zimbabwensis]